jgi:hypothetical protein
MKFVALLIACLSLAGCVTPPTQQQIESADYGTYPGEYKEVITKYMRHRLKDPDSAKYEFLNAPKEGWNGMGGKHFGYVVCAAINARNSYGGYTGAQLSYFMIKNGLVIDAQHGNGRGDYRIMEMCKPFVR